MWCWTTLLPAFGKGHAFSPSKVFSALSHPPLGRPPPKDQWIGIYWNSGHAETANRANRSEEMVTLSEK